MRELAEHGMDKRHKKIRAFVTLMLILAIATSFAACDESDDEDELSADAGTTASSEVITTTEAPVTTTEATTTTEAESESTDQIPDKIREKFEDKFGRTFAVYKHGDVPEIGSYVIGKTNVCGKVIEISNGEIIYETSGKARIILEIEKWTATKGWYAMEG